ncbi:MAG: metal-dependent hydrolase [Clostridiales bacterium]|nr:metal-dependent hydrolase [Clostridiales bacterium]
MIVDFHTHTFPERIAVAALGKLQQASHSMAFSDGTMGGLSASMGRAGIDWSVVLPVATNPLKVRSMNDLSLQLTGKDGLIYFGCVHPDMEGAEQELERIAALGLKGVKLHPVYQGVDIDDARFVRILAKAGELGLTVVMHAGDDIGFPGVVRCSPEMTREALRQSGPVKLICAHMGGWRNWERVADCLVDTTAMMDTAFSLGKITPLEKDYYAPEQLNMLDGEAFCRLVRAFGSRRVVFGTDSPWADQMSSLRQIQALALTEAEKENILGGNARLLLGV